MRSYLLFFLIGWAAFAGVAQIPMPQPYTPAASPSPVVASAAPAASANVPGVSGLMGGFVADAKYKLRVGDTVSFQIKEDIIWNPQDIPKLLIVTDSGEVDVPYIGRVMAVNKTCEDLAAEIKKALEKDYYNKATVVLSLNIANRVLGRIYIWGAVREQGPIEMGMNENLTAGEAILRAGGLGDFANKRDVKVVRPSSDSTGDKVVVLNMEDILEKGHTEKDIVLQPGDFIIVPSKMFNF
jgi:protein involved in polysaccharide export with SLBB domain